jgi:hypothetical protein
LPTSRVQAAVLTDWSAVEDLLAIPFFEGPAGLEPGPGAVEAARLAGVDLGRLLAGQGFRGRAGEAARIVVADRAAGTGSLRQVMAIGIGPSVRGGSGVRDAAQRLAALTAGSASVTTTLAMLGSDQAESIQAAVEGFLLGAHRPPWAGSRPVGGERPAAPENLTLLIGAGGPRRRRQRGSLAGRAGQGQGCRRDDQPGAGSGPRTGWRSYAGDAG